MKPIQKYTWHDMAPRGCPQCGGCLILNTWGEECIDCDYYRDDDDDD